jgi:hypothetical protein
MAVKRPPKREVRRIIRHPSTTKRDAANSVTYLLNDYPRTLFPLSTTKLIAEKWGQQTLDYVYQQVLNPAAKEHSFLSQARCYSSKQGFHLRRTVKLDPVAEVFIYDLVYRNRLLFRKDFGRTRRSFGYRFENGEPLSPTKSYSAFKAAVTEARMKYPFMVKFDIAAYFNSIYHHDLVHWFGENGASADDVEHFGQFLRETNGGRSVDCLPQGIHPCKLIGSEFLKFIDNSMRLRSDVLLRFMDDFYLFSPDVEVINMDFVLIQQLLGDKGLSLNPAKTAYEEEYQDISGEIDEMKVSLLKVRRIIIEVSGEPFEDEELEEENLSEEQVEYLLNLLKNPDIDEADAELVLVLLRDSWRRCPLPTRSIRPSLSGVEPKRLPFCKARRRQRGIGRDCAPICGGWSLRHRRSAILDGEVIRRIFIKDSALPRHTVLNLPASEFYRYFQSEGTRDPGATFWDA